MRLEPELWEALEEICHREGMTLGDVVRVIEQRGHPGGRTSAVRVHIINYFRRAATEPGHASAGHGASDLTHGTTPASQIKTGNVPAMLTSS